MASRSEVTHVIKAQPVPLLTSPIFMGKRNKLHISERKKIPLGKSVKPALMSHELPEPAQGGQLVCSPEPGSSSEQSWAGQTRATSHSRAGAVARRCSQEPSAAGTTRTPDMLVQCPQSQAGAQCGGETGSGCFGGCSPGILPASHPLGSCDAAAKIAITQGLVLRRFYMYNIQIPSPDKVISAFYSLILSKILAVVQERSVFYSWRLYKPTEGYSIIETPTQYLHPALEIKIAF